MIAIPKDDRPGSRPLEQEAEDPRIIPDEIELAEANDDSVGTGWRQSGEDWDETEDNRC